MKQVVVELQGKSAVLLNDTGSFVKVKNKGYSVGQCLEAGTRKKAGYVKWAVAAAAAFVMLLGGGAYAYYTPYADISLDINPSIEFSTNIFDKVIDVTAMNEDAAQLLSQIRLQGCDVFTAVERLVAELAEEGYLSSEEAAELIVTVCAEDQDRAQTMLQEMEQALDQEMVRQQIQAHIQFECVGSEFRTRAQEYGVTPGKLMLVERYAQSTGDPSSVNMEEWLAKSVREIVKATHTNEGKQDGGASGGNGYAGGDSSENGYGGGDQSGNGGNSKETAQNGYSSGEQSGNGYDGGDQGNGQGGAESAGSTGGAQQKSGNVNYGGSDGSDNGNAAPGKKAMDE